MKGPAEEIANMSLIFSCLINFFILCFSPFMIQSANISLKIIFILNTFSQLLVSLIPLLLTNPSFFEIVKYVVPSNLNVYVIIFENYILLISALFIVYLEGLYDLCHIFIVFSKKRRKKLERKVKFFFKLLVLILFVFFLVGSIYLIPEVFLSFLVVGIIFITGLNFSSLLIMCLYGIKDKINWSKFFSLFCCSVLNIARFLFIVTYSIGLPQEFVRHYFLALYFSFSFFVQLVQIYQMREPNLLYFELVENDFEANEKAKESKIKADSSVTNFIG